MLVVPPGRADGALPRVGCSGWNYKSWRGRFYPRELPPSRWLDYYTHVFDTVEVNGTFYRLPEAPTFRAWREQSPSSFLMAVKASRFLTHMKRLRDPEEPLDRLLSRAAELGPRLGPVLYQLPPTLHLDLARLDRFLEALPRGRWTPGRHASPTSGSRAARSTPTSTTIQTLWRPRTRSGCAR